MYAYMAWHGSVQRALSDLLEEGLEDFLVLVAEVVAFQTRISQCREDDGKKPRSVRENNNRKEPEAKRKAEAQSCEYTLLA